MCYQNRENNNFYSMLHLKSRLFQTLLLYNSWYQGLFHLKKVIPFKVSGVIIKQLNYYFISYKITLFFVILLQVSFPMAQKPLNWFVVQNILFVYNKNYFQCWSVLKTWFVKNLLFSLSIEFHFRLVLIKSELGFGNCRAGILLSIYFTS